MRGGALAHGILWGLVCYQAGIASAVIYSWLTRKCSLIYAQHKMTPPPGKLLGLQLKEPRDCFLRICFMILSVVLFVVAGFLVFLGGRETLQQKKVTAPPVIQMPKSKSP
jgi:hypothetical protein